MERMEWKEHKPGIEITSAGANSRNLGKPLPFLNTQFLICKMEIVAMTVLWYPLMFRADVQADLIGQVGFPCPLTLLSDKHAGPEKMTFLLKSRAVSKWE